MAKKKLLQEDPFGARLRDLRKARGFTQAELAEAIGSSQRMIAYYETQGGTPAAPLLLKLARALSVKADELLGLKRDRRPDSAAPQDLRLWRKLKRVERLPASQRRTVVQLIDALVEGEALKKQQS